MYICRVGTVVEKRLSVEAGLRRVGYPAESARRGNAIYLPPDPFRQRSPQDSADRPARAGSGERPKTIGAGSHEAGFRPSHASIRCSDVHTDSGTKSIDRLFVADLRTKRVAAVPHLKVRNRRDPIFSPPSGPPYPHPEMPTGARDFAISPW